jgi:ribosomal protein S18 acetylase RimI-like enzyme
MDDLARQRAATAAVWRADVATRPHGDWADLGGLLVHTTGLPAVHWNGAIVTSDLRHLGLARDWFAERAMPWGVMVPAELDLDPGTGYVTDQRVMLRSLRDLAPTPDVALRWDAGDDCAEVQAEAFGDPVAVAREFVSPKLLNARCAVVVAYDGARPVATATLVSVQGVAAVYGVGTVNDARRQGLGRAVTLAVLHEGVRRGCDLAFLNPSDLGFGMYAALGFAEAPPYRIYRALAETGFAAE